MNNIINKRIAVILGLLMLLNAFSGFYVTQADSVDSEKIQVLVSFGILDDGIDVEQAVTRGTFAQTVCRILGNGIPAGALATQFADVSEDDPAAPAINALNDMKIMQGYGNGFFGINDVVTYEQAAITLVRMLGYEVYTQSLGSYLAVAAQIGILKGTFGEGKLTWETASVMIYNAIFTDVLQRKNYPEESVYFKEGENPLTLWHEISSLNGKIEATEFTSLDSADGVGKGKTKIGGTIFEENSTGAAEYLGCTVTAYYTVDDADNILLYVKNPDINETVIQADMLDPSTNNSKVCYYSGTVLKKIDIDGAIIIYNGRNTGDMEITIPKTGYMRIVDADNDGKADIVYIYEEEVYIISRVNPERGTVTDLYGKEPLVIDKNDSSVIINMLRSDGKDIEIGALKKNYVLNVSRSKDGKLINVVVSSKKVTGIITEISDKSVKIDGNEYKLLDIPERFATLQSGKRSTFYFTADGYIAGYGNPDDVSSAYGYLVAGKNKSKGVDSDKAEFRIFTESGEYMNYYSAKSVLYNRETLTGVQLLEKLKNAYGKVNCGLIKFSLNNNDEIRTIDFPEDRRSCSDGYNISEFTLDWSWHHNSTYVQYDSDMIDSRYNVGSAVCFSAPGTATLSDYYNGKISLDKLEKSVSLFTPSTYWISSEKIYDIDIYDSDERYNAGVVMITGGTVNAVTQEDYFLVDKTVRALDSDEGVGTKLYGLFKNNYVGYMINTDEEVFKNNKALLDLKRGDVIRISLNGLEIVNIIKIFSLNGKPGTGDYILYGSRYDDMHAYENAADASAYIHPGWNSWYEKHRAVHVGCRDVDGIKILCDLGRSEGGIPMSHRIVQQAGPVYVYDEERDEVRIGSLADIDPDDARQSLVMRVRYFSSRDTIIINRVKAPENDILWYGAYSD